jgi:hypothetical protein
MTCPLSDTDCTAIRDALTGTARRWWDTNRDHALALTRAELEAMASSMASPEHRNAAVAAFVTSDVATAWRLEARRLYAQGDTSLMDAWQAYRRGTTDSLSELARRRYEARKLLLDALLTLGEVALGLIGQAIRSRLR